MTDCLLAAPDLALETELVAQAPQFDLRIVRRCLDAADLMGAAAVEPQLPIVVTPGLPRLTRDLVSRLGAERLLIGIAVDQRCVEQLLHLGISTYVVPRSPASTLHDICSALLAGTAALESRPHQGVWSTGAWPCVAKAPTAVPEPRYHERMRARGSVLSVWGPPGSPGRTTTAMMLGRLLAAGGRSVCLIDADTTAPSMLQLCGLVESASGLVVACRFAERDSLDAARLAKTMLRIADRLCVLGGIGHPEQWADVRASALSGVIQACRSACDATIVDLGFGLEDEGAVSPLALGRFQAATAALTDSDAMLAVVESSDLGLTRFLQHRPSYSGRIGLATAVAVVPPHVQGSAAAGAASLREYGLDEPIFELPRCTTEQVVNTGLRSIKRRRGLRRAVGIPGLQEWLKGVLSGAEPD